MKYTILFITFFVFEISSAQQVLNLSPSQLEATFLKQNLELLAEKMNIDIADAEIVQAKLWDNPEISIGDLNFWSSSDQRDGEDIPALWGGVAKNTQFSIELSQLIVTANKRGKEVGLARKQKEINIEEFEEFLRNLKNEFRTQIFEVICLQQQGNLLQKQKETLSSLISTLQKQYDRGYLAKTELLRLQSADFEIERDLLENSKDLHEKEKELKILLSIPPSIQINIENKDDLETFPNPISLNIDELMSHMVMNRPDLKKDQLEISYFDKNIDLEKAQRIPDLNLSIAYDRRGGVWKNYVGFGISFDIPILNRNQGAIRSAKYQKQQSEIQSRQNILTAQNEAIEAYENYSKTYELYSKLKNNSLIDELDEVYTSYEKNLLKRNISLLEFIDFFETYQSNKELLIDTYKNLSVAYEDLKTVLCIDQTKLD